MSQHVHQSLKGKAHSKSILLSHSIHCWNTSCNHIFGYELAAMMRTELSCTIKSTDALYSTFLCSSYVVWGLIERVV